DLLTEDKKWAIYEKTRFYSFSGGLAEHEGQFLLFARRNRTDFNCVVVCRTIHYRLLASKFIQLVQNLLVAAVQGINLVAYYEGIFRSFADAGASTVCFAAFHHVLSAAHSIAHFPGKCMSFVGGKYR